MRPDLCPGWLALFDVSRPWPANTGQGFLIGQKTWRFGDRPEQANAVKLGANFMIASAIEAMGEASSLVEGYDVSGGSFLEMITSTLFLRPVHAGYGAVIAKRRYEPAGFKMTLALKDVRLELEAAEHVATPMPFASVLKDNLLDGIAHGASNRDWAAFAEVSARRAGRWSLELIRDRA